MADANFVKYLDNMNFIGYKFPEYVFKKNLSIQ